MTLMFAGMPFDVFLAIALMSYGKPVRSGGMMFLSVFADHTRRGAGQAPAGRDRSRPPGGRRIKPHRIQSAGASPAAPPASQPRRASTLGATTCPQTVRTQLGRADPCHPAALGSPRPAGATVPIARPAAARRAASRTWPACAGRRTRSSRVLRRTRPALRRRSLPATPGPVGRVRSDGQDCLWRSRRWGVMKVGGRIIKRGHRCGNGLRMQASVTP